MRGGDVAGRAVDDDLRTARAALPWRFPLTWLVLLTTLIIALPLVYSVSNFGTLFRLREMIYLGLLLLPIAAAAETQSYSGRMSISISPRRSANRVAHSTSSSRESLRMIE